MSKITFIVIPKQKAKGQHYSKQCYHHPWPDGRWLTTHDWYREVCGASSVMLCVFLSLSLSRCLGCLSLTLMWPSLGQRLSLDSLSRTRVSATGKPAAVILLIGWLLVYGIIIYVYSNTYFVDFNIKWIY